MFPVGDGASVTVTVAMDAEEAVKEGEGVPPLALDGVGIREGCAVAVSGLL